MATAQWLAVSNSLRELLIILFIVLVPTVPLTILGWSMLGRRRRTARGQEQDIESGRSPATPFAAISVVGSVIAAVAVVTLLIVVAVRAIAA